MKNLLISVGIFAVLMAIAGVIDSLEGGTKVLAVLAYFGAWCWWLYPSDNRKESKS